MSQNEEVSKPEQIEKKT